MIIVCLTTLLLYYKNSFITEKIFYLAINNTDFMPEKLKIHVTSEIGQLKRLIIHSPDGGIGKIVPGKFKEWLYDDTVHLSQMRKEYNNYIKLLLFFLDPAKAKYICDFEKNNPGKNDCYKPESMHYYNSDYVLDTQFLLAKILKNKETRKRIIAAICAWEGVSTMTEKKLEKINNPHELAKILISGTLKDDKNKNSVFIFPPLPNFIFTRDIGITINDHFLLSNAHTPARERESLLMRYIAQNLLFKNREEKLIEISEPGNFFLLDEETQLKKKTSIEGGDVMMIAPNHLLIGCSERTTASGINELVHAIFKNKNTAVEKISVVKIPKHRAIMHIDTVFTQVRKDMWVLFGRFSDTHSEEKEKRSYYERITHEDAVDKDFLVEVFRFEKKLNEKYIAQKNYETDISHKIKGLESLLRNISIEDFGIAAEEVKIIYSADNIFPYDEREQWTDSCNLLALKEGVVVGYQRNEKTAESFKQHGFKVVSAEELINDFSTGKKQPAQVQNTLILLPDAELSRARGGSHCMSLPLWREKPDK